MKETKKLVEYRNKVNEIGNEILDNFDKLKNMGKGENYAILNFMCLAIQNSFNHLVCMPDLLELIKQSPTTEEIENM